jgi:hypothetical protein
MKQLFVLFEEEIIKAEKKWLVTCRLLNVACLDKKKPHD